MLDDLPLITVTDLKQFSYCGRVVYDERCLPHMRPRTLMSRCGTPPTWAKAATCPAKNASCRCVGNAITKILRE